MCTLCTHTMCSNSPKTNYSCNYLWWVDLGWLPDSHPGALSLPLLKTTGGDTMMDKLIGWDKGSSITKAKGTCGIGAKRGNWLSTSQHQADVQLLPGKQGLNMHMSCLGRQTSLIHNSFSSSFIPPRFIAEHDVIWHGIYLWSVGVPPILLLRPRLLALWVREGCLVTQLMLCEHCIAIAKTGALSTRF